MDKIEVLRKYPNTKVEYFRKDYSKEHISASKLYIVNGIDYANNRVILNDFHSLESHILDESITPILRPMSSITEKEKIQICMMAHNGVGMVTDDYEITFWENTEFPDEKVYWVKMKNAEWNIEVSVGINSKTGNVQRGDKEEVLNQKLIIDTYRKWNLDIDNLIQSGIAKEDGK